MRPIQVDRRAKAELRKAMRDYRKRDPARARRFADEFMARIHFVLRFPEAGQRIPEHTRFLVQRYLMDDFPFKLIIASRGDRMKVIAVAHHGQPPDYWEDRLEDMDEDEKKTRTKKTTTKKGGKKRTTKRKKK